MKEPDLHVAVTNLPSVDAGGCKRDVHSTVKLDNTSGTIPKTLKLMGMSANRTGLIVSFLGQSIDTAFLCGSKVDGENLAGSEWMGLQVTPEMHGTNEIWVAVDAGVSMRFGVVATFEDRN